MIWINKKNKIFLKLLLFICIKPIMLKKEEMIKMKLTPVSLILMFLAMISCAQETAEMSVDTVYAALNDSAEILLLDVRTVPEYDGPLGHIQGSALIPLSELSDRLPELEAYKNKQIIVVCRSGNRSGMATRILNEKGFKAVNMAGGMLAWNRRFPVVRQESEAAADTLK